MMRRFGSNQAGQALVEFAVSAMAGVLLLAALAILAEAATLKTQALIAARYAAWHHLTARDTAQITRAFFSGRQADVTLKGERSHHATPAMSAASLERTFGTPILLYLTAHHRALRAKAEVRVEHRPSALRVFGHPDGPDGPFRTTTKALVATDPWDRVASIEVGVAVTGQLPLIPVLLPFTLF